MGKEIVENRTNSILLNENKIQEKLPNLLKGTINNSNMKNSILIETNNNGLKNLLFASISNIPNENRLSILGKLKDNTNENVKRVSIGKLPFEEQEKILSNVQGVNKIDITNPTKVDQIQNFENKTEINGKLENIEFLMKISKNNSYFFLKNSINMIIR